MSLILAIETSSEACSAALANNGEIHQLYEIVRQGHSARILPMIEELMHSSGYEMSALDAIAFGNGPGSFTGVRIGASVTQGLALALDCPVISVSSLAALAQAMDAPKVLATQDARMGEIYWGCYERSAKGLVALSGEEHVSSPSDIHFPMAGSWVGAGSGVSVFGEILSQKFGKELTEIRPNMLPAAREVAILAESYWQAGKAVSAESAIPSYVRNNVAKKPKHKSYE